MQPDKGVQQVRQDDPMVGSAYQGPIPSPEMMKEYAEIDSEIPGRILSMAEADSRRDAGIIETENEKIRRTLSMEATGQKLVFIVMLLQLAAAVFFFMEGNNVAGAAFLTFPALKELKGIFSAVASKK